MWRSIGVAASTCLTVASLAGAQPQAATGNGNDRKQALAFRVPDGSIRVDGRLAEPAWNLATPITDFVQKEPNEGVPPTEETEVRILYDDGGLYVGARMYHREGGRIQAPLARRDRGEQAEHFYAAFDTFLDHRTAYMFGVTAAGVRLDRFHPLDDEETFDEGFDPVWRAQTSVDEQGWVAELWIPFSQLRFTPRDEQIWGLNLQRFTPTLSETDYWSPVPRTDKAWASRFGELRGINGLRSNRRIELLPYVAGASTLYGNRDHDDPFDDGQNLEGRTGLDMKFGIGSNLTLDAAINPDFGQVEADPAEVNLSAFETIFPEKRPFFLEGARLLNHESVDNWFYTRRIGAPPTGPAAGEFVDYPRTTTILGAAKLTGRLPSGTSLGLLAAVTDEESAKIGSLSSPDVTEFAVAPRSLFGNARVQQEIGRNASTVAGMVTFVHRNVEEGEPLSQLLPRTALGLSGDSLFRFKGGEYEWSAWGGTTFVEGEARAIERVQRSSAHYFQRPDQSYSKLNPTLTSLASYKTGSVLEKTGGRHWLWRLQTDFEGAAFETNDYGRVRSADGIMGQATLRYRETRTGDVFRNYVFGVTNTNEWNNARNRQSGTLRGFAYQTWRNFWYSQIDVISNFRALDQRLARGGPLMGTPGGVTVDLRLRNNNAARNTWNVRAIIENDEDGGSNRQFTGSITTRPSPRWNFAIYPTLQRQVDSQQYATTRAGDRPEVYLRRYIFARIDRTTFSSQFRLGYTFRPDLNLDIYAEPFTSSGDYEDFGELALPRTRDRRTYGEEPGTTATRQEDGTLLVTDGSDRFTLANYDFNVQSFRSNVVLRWEWRPGSTLYVVWQQDRSQSEAIGRRVSINDMFNSLTAPGANFFVVKTSFWVGFR